MAAEQALAAGLYEFRYSVGFICGITGCHRSLASLGNLDTGGSSSWAGKTRNGGKNSNKKKKNGSMLRDSTLRQKLGPAKLTATVSLL